MLSVIRNGLVQSGSILLFAAMFSLMSWQSALAQQVDSIPGLVFEKDLTDKSFGQRLHSLAVEDNHVFVIASLISKNNGLRTTSLLQLDLTGNFLKKESLQALLSQYTKDINFDDPEFASVIFATDDKLYLPFADQDNRITTAELSQQGSPTPTVKSITMASSQAFDIVGGLKTTGSDLVYFGNTGLQPEIKTLEGRLAVFGPDNLISQSQFALTSAINMQDKHWILWGERITDGQHNSWLVQIDPTGAITKQAEFDGKPLEMVQADNGDIGLLSYQVTNDGYTVSLLSLAAQDFSLNWKKTLLVEQGIAPRLSIQITKDGFMLAGVKQRGLWLQHVDLKGNIKWTYNRQPTDTEQLEMISSFKFESVQEAFFVAYTAYIVVGRTQYEVTKLIRFDNT